ncbi:MAG: uridine diphosphate-N-acetylglucosamine-binding protein YvcK [Acidimicrobiia bacterium]|nr:uridine diphosphate-N-acetylglucosamine-binding protein YvcK [Acidimicrobiia bacterium]
MTAPDPMVALQPFLLDSDGPAVVAIGGGHGLAQILQACQSYAGRIDAIVSVADNGGSSGRLSPALDIPPPGDLRKCLLALSPEPSVWAELVDFRFGRGDIAGHSLGNLMLAALADLTGDFISALDLCGEMLGAVGQVHPVALGSMQLAATIEGREVSGQVAVAESHGHIDRLSVVPSTIPTNRTALSAISAADQIVLAPGSLYTSLLSALVVAGVAEALDRARGSLVHVLNLVTQHAETLGMSGHDHVDALVDLSGLTRTGTILAHDGPLSVPEGLDRVDVEEPEWRGWSIARADVIDRHADWPQHDAIRLGTALKKLAGDP